MKSKKLLDKLSDLMGLGDDAGQKEVEKLRKVLNSLKEKQKELYEKLERAESEHERHKLKQKIEVIQRQRKKGLEVYQVIREARDD